MNGAGESFGLGGHGRRTNAGEGDGDDGYEGPRYSREGLVAGSGLGTILALSAIATGTGVLLAFLAQALGATVGAYVVGGTNGDAVVAAGVAVLATVLAVATGAVPPGALAGGTAAVDPGNLVPFNLGSLPVILAIPFALGGVRRRIRTAV